AIQSALRIRSEETAGRAEPVLATPVSRVQYAFSHLTIAFGGTFAVMVLLGLTFGVSDAAVTGDAGAIGQAVGAALLFRPGGWVFGGARPSPDWFVPARPRVCRGGVGRVLRDRDVRAGARSRRLGAEPLPVPARPDVSRRHRQGRAARGARRDRRVAHRAR